MRAQQKKAVAGIACIAMSAGLAAGCGGGESGGDTVSKKSITIVHMASTTGAIASYRASIIPPTQMALKVINADGGINGATLKSKEYDSASKPAQAVSTYRRVSKDTVAIVGPNSSAELSAVAPLANAAGIPLVAGLPSIVQIAKDNRPNVFMTSPSFQPVAKDATDAWFAKTGVKNVAVLSNTQDISTKGQADYSIAAMKSSDRKIVRKVDFQNGTTDFGPLVKRTVAGSVDGVFVCSQPQDGVAIVQELKRQEYGGPILLCQFSFGPQFTDNVGKAGIGVYTFTSLWLQGNPAPSVAKWVAEYEKAAKTPANAPAALVYESWLLLAEAMRKADVTGMPVDKARKAIAAELPKVSITGITGDEVKFNKDGFIDRAGTLLQVGPNGESVKVS